MVWRKPDILWNPGNKYEAKEIPRMAVKRPSDLREPGMG